MLKKVIVVVLGISLVLTIGSVTQIWAQKIEIEFWYHGSALEVASIEALSKKFEEIHPDVNVKPLCVNLGFAEKIRARIAAGNPPDIAYIYDQDFAYLAEAGQLMDLTPFIEKDPDINIGDRLIWWRKEVNGELKNFGWGTAVEVPALWYNKDIFDRYGVEYPPATLQQAWTWDEFVEVSKKLTRDKSGNSGISDEFNPLDVETFGAYTSGRTQILEVYFLSNNTSLFAQDMEILIDQPENIEVLQAVADLMYKQHVMPTPELSGTFLRNMGAFLQTGKIGMFIEGQWSLQALAEADFTLGVGVVPKFKRALSIDFTFLNGIYSKTKNPEMAWEFYKFLGDPKYVLPVIQSGLWMPLDAQWYTDPDLIELWMTEGVHPPEYRTAVIDALWQTVQVMDEPYIHWWRKEHNKSVYDIIQPELDRLWLGKLDAKTVARDIAEKVRALK